ncbi:AAA family ATPase [Microcystis viridis]|uniref:XRE family transcriptional regulator n=1 Tax=Microcystis viridis FACHB-1342 TaxID=2692900 RepID=A0ABR8GER6_MICVR|nr:AAA family ATPase [Microcystis viridis]MBD2601833.1 XRE family transcriptional regulator [Microcystis viridis FACHB-1342]
MGRSIGITDQGRILLKGRLQELGISQTELAGKCFLSEKTIERLFQKHNIDRANLNDVCVFLGVPVSEVVDPDEWNRLQNLVNPHNPAGEFNQIEQHIPRQIFKNIVDDKTREFVGREYIYDQIDEYLKDESFPSGYIILKGEPGIGKTALMAKLVRKRKWIHHFVTEGTDSTESFLASICSQLIVKYELPYSKLPECQPEQRILTYRKFIDEELLPQAIEKAKDNTVVILVDALDEAKRSPLDGELNILGLPKALPQGVFFIVTSREADDQHFYVNNNKRIDIKDDDEDNLNDVRLYVESYLNDPGVRQQIEKWQVSDADFVEKITKKSEGNFMYLFYVMTDIKEQKLSEDIKDSIHDLPQGLNGYYNKHWDFMEKSYKDRFREIDEKVIRIIAALHTPASISYIAEISKFPTNTVSEIINLWRNCFNEIIENNKQHYRIYHRSFYDFLKRKLHFDDITSFDVQPNKLIVENMLNKLHRRKA